jgi:hypothetical protein
MGRTVAPISFTFIRAKESFSAFRKALRRSDQLALDELFVYANLHLAPAAYAAHPLPFQIFLLAMLLEEHKEVKRIQQLIEETSAGFLHKESHCSCRSQKVTCPPKTGPNQC